MRLPPFESHAVAWSIITITHWLLGHSPSFTESFSHWPTNAARLPLLSQTTSTSVIPSFSSTWIPVPFASIPLYTPHSCENPNFTFTRCSENLNCNASLHLCQHLSQQLSHIPDFLVVSVLDRSHGNSKFNFLRNGHTVFTAAAPFYIPTDSTHACPLLSTLMSPTSSFVRLLGHPKNLCGGTQSLQSSNTELFCLPNCVLSASEISNIMDVGSFTVVSLRPGITRWTAKKKK